MMRRTGRNPVIPGPAWTTAATAAAAAIQPARRRAGAVVRSVQLAIHLSWYSRLAEGLGLRGSDPAQPNECRAAAMVVLVPWSAVPPAGLLPEWPVYPVRAMGVGMLPCGCEGRQ